MKFGMEGWSQVGMVCVWVVSWLAKWHSLDSAEISLLVLLTLASLIVTLSRCFVYWDLNSHRLRQQHFWNKKELAWDEVTRVSEFLPGVVRDRSLAVWYANPSSRSGSSYIVVSPGDRQQFISALQRFATQATFEI